MLYKYKAITTLNELDRVIDILQNYRLYFPNYQQLNDPLEGSGGNIMLSGWAGVSILIARDEELEPIEIAKQRYGILSLSETAISPQLWAHYTNNYQGVCLCFRTDGILRGAKKVKYEIDRGRVFAEGEKSIKAAVKRNLLYKQKGWEYEQEWRCILETDDLNRFRRFEKEELQGIIIGNNLSDTVKDILIRSLDNHIRALVAKPGYQTFRINILPWGYDIPGDGRSPDYITSIPDYLGV